MKINREKITIDDYFEMSRKEKLPKRCPILHKCERRLSTIYLMRDLDYAIEFFGEDEKEKRIIEVLKKEELISKNYEKEVVKANVNPSKRVKIGNLMILKNVCPEVSLFEVHDFTGYVPKISAIEVNFRTDGSFSDFTCGHYSECAEFSKHHYERGTKKNSQNKNRVGISKKLRFEIYQRDNFTCQYCGRTKSDGIKLQIDHKIAVVHGGKTDFENLNTSCEDCNLGKSNKMI